MTYSATSSPPILHRSKPHGTNLCERHVKEIKRRVDVLGIVSDVDLSQRLIGVALCEANHAS